MATAARLAKAGHQVRLIEAGDRLGSPWANGSAPTVLSFPAPLRDLFRKSGRPLEEESRRAGLELVPAPPTRHIFADGSIVDLPVGRGEQFEAIRARCGDRAAQAWRELMDALADVWQQLRFLGLETELVDPSPLDRRTRAALWADRSLADLAGTLPDHRLRALVADLGYLIGSTPGQTPANCAVGLFVESTFGRWQFQADRTTSAENTAIGPLALSELTTLLSDRLQLRRVTVRLQTEVPVIETDRTGVRAVLTRTADGAESWPVEAVVVCDDPWLTYRDRLTGARTSRRFRAERRAISRNEPALSPQIDRCASPDRGATPDRGDGGDTETWPSETYEHRDGRPPVLEARHQPSRPRSRQEPDQRLAPEQGATEHAELLRLDFDTARPDVSAGVRWRGFASWLDRPPTAGALAGLFFAGPSSRSGQGPDREILSAALAANSVMEFLRTRP